MVLYERPKGEPLVGWTRNKSGQNDRGVYDGLVFAVAKNDAFPGRVVVVGVGVAFDVFFGGQQTQFEERLDAFHKLTVHIDV